MAKRRGRPSGSKNTSARQAQRPNDIQGLMNRVQSWMQEREALASELRRVADSLSAAVVQGPPPSLSVVQGVASSTASAGEGGMISSGRAAKRRTMSPEARAKIAEAQRKRWAAQKSGAPGAAKAAKGAKTAKRGGGTGVGGG